jgi:hypothetical protein
LVLSLAGSRDLSLLRKIQTTAEVHISYAPAWGGGTILRGKAAGGLSLTTHLHLVPNLRLSEATIPLAHTPSQRAKGRSYLFLYPIMVELVNVNWIKLALYCIQCQFLPFSVSQIMVTATHLSLKRGRRKSSVSLPYCFQWIPVMCRLCIVMNVTDILNTSQNPRHWSSDRDCLFLKDPSHNRRLCTISVRRLSVKSPRDCRYFFLSDGQCRTINMSRLF